MNESRLQQEYEALIWECEGLEEDIEERKDENEALRAERDLLQREVCRHRAAAIQDRTPEQIADALGWNCFKEDGK